MQVLVQLGPVPRTGVPAQGSVPKTASLTLTYHPDPVPGVEGSGPQELKDGSFLLRNLPRGPSHHLLCLVDSDPSFQAQCQGHFLCLSKQGRGACPSLSPSCPGALGTPGCVNLHLSLSPLSVTSRQDRKVFVVLKQCFNNSWLLHP